MSADSMTVACLCRWEAPLPNKRNKVKKQRLNWTAEQLELAKEAVQVRELSKAEAAREFGVERRA